MSTDLTVQNQSPAQPQGQPQPGEPQTDSIHILDYWRIVLKRWKIISFITFITLIIGIFACLHLPKKYSSSTQIEVRKTEDQMDLNMSSRFTRSDRVWLETQFQTIKSEMILSQVVKDLDLVTYFKERKESSLIGNICKTMDWSEENIRSMMKFGGSKKKNSDDSQLTDEEKQQISMNYAVAKLKKMIATKSERDTTLINISVTLPENDSRERGKSARYMAKIIAHKIAEVYKSTKEVSNQENIASKKDSVENKLAKDLSSVKESYKVAQAVQEKYTLPAITGEIQKHVENPEINSLKAKLVEATTALAEESIKLKKLESLNRDKSKNLEETLNVLVEKQDSFSRLKDELNEAVRDFEMLKLDYGPKHPTMRRAEKKKSQLEKQLAERTQGAMEAFRIRKALAEEKVAELRKQIAILEEESRQTQLKYGEYNKAVLAWQDFKKELQKTQESKSKLDMTERYEINATTIIESATVPLKSSSPNNLRNFAIVLILSFLLGAGAGFFLEYLDTSIKTVDELEKMAQSQVLGVVPSKVGLLYSKSHSQGHEEIYRMLHTNLSFALKDDKKNVIAITSSGAGEGKSTSCANLAYVSAKAGKKVLLIDADLRRPVQHKFVNDSNEFGVADLLQGSKKPKELIQDTPVKNLSLITAGNMNEKFFGLINPQAMTEAINELRADFDLIIIDSPPILGVNDAAILANVADATMLVVKYSGYPRGMVLRAHNTLKSTADNMCGVILNNVNMKTDNYYASYYQPYHYHERKKKQT